MFTKWISKYQLRARARDILYDLCVCVRCACACVSLNMFLFFFFDDDLVIEQCLLNIIGIPNAQWNR